MEEELKTQRIQMYPEVYPNDYATTRIWINIWLTILIILSIGLIFMASFQIGYIMSGNRYQELIEEQEKIIYQQELELGVARKVKHIMFRNNCYETLIYREIMKTWNPVQVALVIEQESHFNPFAVSWAGCIGLMQINPFYHGENATFDIARNIQYGAKYLEEQYINFGQDWDLARAAYNAGPGAVLAHGGIPQFTETINYVRRLAIKSAEIEGFSNNMRVTSI
jgi:hypothetical protein